MQPSLFRLFLMVSLFFEGVFTSLIPLTAQTVPAPLPASFSAPGLRLYAAAEGADGLVYLVGEMDAGAQDRNGVILVFDPQTNRLAQWGPDRGSAKNDGFRAIAALPNGKLAVGGYRERDAGIPEPWLLLIDLLDGQALEFPVLDSNPGVAGISLLAANDRNQVLAVGFKALNRDTAFWSAALDGTLSASRSLAKEPLQSGKEAWKDVRALFPAPSGDFILAGNYRLGGSKNQMWLLTVSPEGRRKELPLAFGVPRWDRLSTACMSAKGHYLVFGETERKGGGTGPNAWLQEFNPSGEKVGERTFGGVIWDQALFIQPAARNEVLIGFRSDLQRGGQMADSIFLVGSETAPFSIDPPSGFTPDMKWLTAVHTFDNRYALLGFGGDPRRSVAALISPPQAESKGTPAVSFRLSDPNNLPLLRPGDEVEIRVLVKNHSGEELFGISLKPAITGTQAVGLSVPATVVKKVLAPGQETSLEFRVKADITWQPAPVTIRIRPFIQDQEQPLIQAILPLPSSTTRGAAALYFMDDSKRTVPKSENSIKTTLQYQLPKGYDESRLQVKPKKNGALVVNNKNGGEPLTLSRKDLGNQIITTLEVDFPLDQDTSYLSAELWLDGVLLASTSESIRVIRNYRTSLHVLSIGPPYKSFKPLKFTSKDARDVGDLFRRQPGMAEGGLFDTVFVQVLDDSLKTTRIAIERAFEDLARKAKPNYTAADRIDPEDVVVVFISSHGEVFGGDFHILGSDADGYRSTALNLQYCMGTYLYSIPCKMIFLLDACHAGSAKGDDGARMSALLDFLRESPADRLILASSSENQSSYEDDGWQNGLFTEALLRVFAAKAGASGEEMLSPNDLFRAMEIEMQALNQNKYTQTPHLVPGGGTLLKTPIFKPR